MPTKPKTSHQAPGHDASPGSRRHMLFIVAALAVGFVVVRRLRGSNGATVPARDPSAAAGDVTGDPSMGVGGMVGGVPTAGDGTPAIGSVDLATALQPFGDQLDNLQAQVDANSAAVTTLLVDAPTTDAGKLKPSQFSVSQLAVLGSPNAGPSPFSADDTTALAHYFGTMTPAQLIALGVGSPTPKLAPPTATPPSLVRHLESAPVIAATPTGAAPVVQAAPPAPSAPAPTPAPPRTGARVAA